MKLFEPVRMGGSEVAKGFPGHCYTLYIYMILCAPDVYRKPANRAARGITVRFRNQSC